MKQILILVILFLLCGPVFAETWQRYNDKTQGLMFSNTSSVFWLTDPGSTLITTREALVDAANVFIADSVTYDWYDGTFWANQGGDTEIYHFSMHPATGEIILIETITYAAITLESVVADPYDGTIWVLDDTTDVTKITHAERVGDAGNLDIIATINISGDITSGQGITYDMRSNTLWITGNTNEVIKQFTTTGTLLSTIDASTFLISASTSLQALTHDYYTDTLWVCERGDGVYHIDTSGNLLSLHANITGANGPTGVAVLPRRFFSPMLPIIWWKMEDTGGNTITDSMNFRDATTSDAITSVTGKIGNAIDFEADNDQFADFTSFALTNDFTISAWYKLDTLAATSVIIGENSLDNVIEIEADGDINYEYAAGGPFLYTAAEYTPLVIPANVWFHFVIQRMAGHLNLWVDGAEAPSREGSVKDADFTIDRLGRRTVNPFDGIMDEVMIFNYAISPEDVARIYNNGEGISDLFDLNAPAVTGGGYRARYRGLSRY